MSMFVQTLNLMVLTAEVQAEAIASAALGYTLAYQVPIAAHVAPMPPHVVKETGHAVQEC